MTKQEWKNLYKIQGFASYEIPLSEFSAFLEETKDVSEDYDITEDDIKGFLNRHMSTIVDEVAKKIRVQLVLQ